MLARVPWVKPLHTKPKLQPRKLNRERERRLVDDVAEVLHTGEPTLFAFEAVCRHAIRYALCRKGWQWEDADLAAARVVSMSLNLIGAERPSWAQGQPGWTEPGALPIERTRCARCRKPLPDDRPKYCSDHCRQGAKDARTVEQRSAEALAARIVCERVGARK
jgi:hypothetical protein